MTPAPDRAVIHRIHARGPPRPGRACQGARGGSLPPLHRPSCCARPLHAATNRRSPQAHGSACCPVGDSVDHRVVSGRRPLAARLGPSRANNDDRLRDPVTRTALDAPQLAGRERPRLGLGTDRVLPPCETDGADRRRLAWRGPERSLRTPARPSGADRTGRENLACRHIGRRAPTAAESEDRASRRSCLPTVPPGRGRSSVVIAEGGTIGEVLRPTSCGAIPAWPGQVLTDDGTLHRFVNVYVNDDDVRYLGSSTPGERRRRGLDPSRRGRGLRRRRHGASPRSILDLIGNTPLVDVSQLSPNPDVRILSSSRARTRAGRSRTGSPSRWSRQAEKDGLLAPGQPGQVLLEPTSGNTGIGLALVCRVKGYHLKVVLPTNVSVERRQLLEVWGAEIIESPGVGGLQRRGPDGATARRASTPSGSCSTSTRTGQPPGPLRGRPVPRSGGTAPRSPTSLRASAPRAPFSAWAGS